MPGELDESSKWARLPNARTGELLCGLRRSFLYKLCTAGKIRSIKVTADTSKRGCRLIYLPSLHEYLEELLKESDAEQGAAKPSSR